MNDKDKVDQIVENLNEMDSHLVELKEIFRKGFNEVNEKLNSIEMNNKLVTAAMNKRT